MCKFEFLAVFVSIIFGLSLTHALHADPEVARYIGYGKPRTETENRRLLEITFKAYRADNLGHLAACLRDTGEIIGRCGLSLLDEQVPRWFWTRNSAPKGLEIVRRIEVGYTFVRQHWGNGYATESATAVRDYAFESRHEDLLVAAIFPENIASITVAKKIGMSFRGPITAFGMPAEHHQLDRDDWALL